MSEQPGRLRTLVGHLANHGAAVVKIGIVSVLGIAASFGFQIVTARSLGLADFGILSSFFAIVSVAAIGSGSLQNAVAVQTARALANPEQQAPRRGRLDGFTIEALVLGGAGALIVAAGSPLIASALHTEVYVPILAGISILLSFLFSRAVGTIQGTGDSQGSVWWTTISLILRLALVAGAFALALGLSAALVSVLVASGIAALGAILYTRRLRVVTHHRPFRREGIVVIVMTIAFAWLSNADIILIRSEAAPEAAGLYAAAAMLVKSGFLIPGTLSIYLLPRFVRQEGNASMTRLGVRLTLLTTALGGLALVAFFLILGGWAMTMFFGATFHVEGLLLAGLSLAYLPWIMAQGLLIRMNALASRAALMVLAAAAAVQLGVGLFLLPNIAPFVALIAILGVVVLGSFLFIDHRSTRRQLADEVTIEQLPPLV